MVRQFFFNEIFGYSFEFGFIDNVDFTNYLNSKRL